MHLNLYSAINIWETELHCISYSEWVANLFWAMQLK
jgi:hypothetical protein